MHLHLEALRHRLHIQCILSDLLRCVTVAGRLFSLHASGLSRQLVLDAATGSTTFQPNIVSLAVEMAEDSLDMF
jgi:hypothetical protein